MLFNPFSIVPRGDEPFPLVDFHKMDQESLSNLDVVCPVLPPGFRAPVLVAIQPVFE